MEDPKRVNKTIDREKPDSMKDKIALMKSVVESQTAKNQEIPWYQSYPSAIARGGIEGLARAGEMFSGGNIERKMLDPTYTAQQDQDVRQKLYEEYLPIGQGSGPRAAEHMARSVVEGGALPGGTVGSVMRRTAAGALGAEGAKELGVPEWGQNLIEMGAQFAPSLAKKIPTNTLTAAGREEGKLLEGARNLGLTEGEIAMSLKPEGRWEKAMRFFSGKTGRTANRLEKTKDSLGKVYGTLEASADATKILNSQDSETLINSMSQSFDRLPARQRELIQADWDIFLKKPRNANSMIDFWQKIQDPITRGEGKIGILKGPLLEGLNKISPQLASDFELTNKLYGNFSKIKSQLHPDLIDKFIKTSELGALVTGIATMNAPVLMSVLGAETGRQVATELSGNPRLINLTTRFISSINRGLPQIAKQIWNQMQTEIGKTNAMAASKMSEADFSELLKSLPKEEEQNSK